MRDLAGGLGDRRLKRASWYGQSTLSQLMFGSRPLAEILRPQRSKEELDATPIGPFELVESRWPIASRSA
jgi:hypothetical protein